MPNRMPRRIGITLLQARSRFATHFRSWVRRYEKPIMVLLAAAGLTAILMNLEFNILEATLYDLRASASTTSPPDSRIALIAIDEVTTKSLDKVSPLPLDYHAKLLESLEHYQPRGIGYLVDMSQVHQLDPDLFQESGQKNDPANWSERFVESAERLRARGTAVEIGTRFDVTGEVAPPYPLSRLPHAIAVIHKDGNVFSEDKVTRRALISLNGSSAFHVDFARSLGLLAPDALPRGTFTVPEIDSRYFFFRYYGDTTMKALRQSGTSYTYYSFGAVMRGEVPIEALRGKIVLVGTIKRESSSDFAYTPYSRAPFVNPKLVIHANILDSVINNGGVERVAPWVNGAVTFLTTAAILWCVLTLTPLYGVFGTIVLSVGLLLCGLGLFSWKGLWLRESPPLVGIFVGYYLAVPYRLFREYRKRWEYQRKNQILTQVEELKTNFLNLVTHDLKTPVARIQGLAEVLLRKAHERLVDRDRETLRNIISSTDELNHFISSILELSKVESQRLYLNIQSKDINQLIEKCVEGFKASARAKQIRLEVALEPLFPIRVDPSLISKVINNLIDNSIKYSRPGSEVQITSIENGPWVEISVRDQGIGLSPEEKENLFTRFYRAKNDRTAETPGTGLGLYLTRYFVEAHGGRVEVESERTVGSRFVIRLPVEGATEGAIAEPATYFSAPATARPGLRLRIRTAVRELVQASSDTDD
jgi:signal transduction histidine kinase